MTLAACILFALTIASFIEFGIETGRLPYMRRRIIVLTIGLTWPYAIGDDEELSFGLVGYWLIMLTAVRIVMFVHALWWLARGRWAMWRDVPR